MKLIDSLGNEVVTFGQVRLASGSASSPPLTFAADAGTGIYLASTNILGIAALEIRTDGLIRAGGGYGGTPTFSFGEDTDTGLYRYDSDTLGFSCGGVDALRVGSDQVTIIGLGDFGEGTAQIGNTEGNGFISIHGEGTGSVSLWGYGGILAILDNEEYSYLDFSFDTRMGGPIVNCHGPIAKCGATDEDGGQCFCVADEDGSATGLQINGTKVVGAQGSSITGPGTGGSTIDSEARASINSIIARLEAHGLIAS